MRVLVVGAGGVGEAFARIAARRSSFEHVVLADFDPARAARAAEGARALAASSRRASSTATTFSSAEADAGDERAVTDLATSARCDAVLNAVDPRFVMPVFKGALGAGATYLDMAMSLSAVDAELPYERTGVMLGEDQFAMAPAWEDRGLLALCGMGVEPGLSDVFARHAADNLFTSIEEIGVRDGADLTVDGYDFCPTFSIWTTIEECLNPPVVYERDRGWFTTAPFSEPEVFLFPEGIGPVECVNVEHEEVVLIPRVIDAGRVTFKYGLGERFIEVLSTIHLLGLDSTVPIPVRGASVSPRDVIAAALPDPASIGHLMHGRTCAGTYLRGTGKDGAGRSVYLYHVVDNDWTMAEYGSQAVVWQTAINPVIALELLSDGAWSGAGVIGPEALSPAPFLDLLGSSGAPWAMENRSAG